MRPHSNSLARSSIYWLVLLMAVALALSVLLLLWFTLPVQAQSESVDNNTDDARLTGKHLITFRGNKLPNNYAERIADVGGSVATELPEIGVVVADGLTEDAVERLGAFEDVEAVEQDMERRWIDPQESASAEVAAVEESSAEEPLAEVASPEKPGSASFYARQWNMRQIKADRAWATGQFGDPSVSVAILDTGIDKDHPDLRGLVAGGPSKSFVSSDKTDIEKFPGSPAWADLNYHGTHVAATVSSKARAAAGVTSDVTLIAVKVLNKEGKGSASDILEGLIYAANQGADVINMSLEASFDKKMLPGTVASMNRAFNYANRKGSVIVVAAGNDNLDLNADSNRYQAYCQSTHVVCVSATGPTSGGVNGPWEKIDEKASYSNYGSPVVVAAPGGNGNSKVWAACSRTSLVHPICQTGTFIVESNGTSMAAPHVSGLAALLVNEIGKEKPSQVAAQIRQSADDLGDPDKDMIYGHGRINVAKALGLEGS
jgi:lantibiotic leader peptide-processing serine protease